MLRALRFFIIVSLLAVAAAWLAREPGVVSLDWRGWRIETSGAVLAFAAVVFGLAVAFVHRLWRYLRGAPSRIGASSRRRKRTQGYQALTKGMVALAAGDAEEARRHGRRAEGLLNDPPITMLLSAQAAQLAGDETAAKRFFDAMSENPETEFLGLRGLLSQAMKDGDYDQGLDLARRARRLRPESPWVAEALFDLQSRKGLWLEAKNTTEQAARGGLIGRRESSRRRARLAMQTALEAKAKGEDAVWRRESQAAADLDPDLIPAALELTRAALKSGKRRKAASAAERAWAARPHPALAPLYYEAKRADDALSVFKAAQKLAGFNPEHAESRLAVAEAAVDAELWGEARAAMTKLMSAAEPSARACRLMARLEDSGGKPETARDWLVRAGAAPPDPSWVCSGCGNSVDEWSAVCGNCGAFGSFDWTVAPHVSGLPGAPAPAPGQAPAVNAPKKAPGAIPPAQAAAKPA
ncbi:MAG: heme biosynthesis HemY N-terminal domain-containing protein [Rhodospirillales bacterium]